MVTDDIRRQFPIFDIHPGLIYLDNAATTQRPESVIRTMDTFYREENASIHRGVYELSANATARYEGARQAVADFIGSESASSIGFTKGTTESVNIVAQGFLKPRLKAGDNVVISIAEHHANFIPWQQVCKETGANLRVAPMDEETQLDMDSMRKMIDGRTKLVAVTHISNTLGTVFPVDEILAAAKEKDVPVLIDAAQSAALYPLDVSGRKIDFLAFSGHKIFGPFGTGVLYVSKRYQSEVRPIIAGGGMIRQVTVDETIFQPFPFSLDAGTPNVAGVMGLQEAIRFIETLDREAIRKYLQEITEWVKKELEQVDGLHMVGSKKGASSIISFNIEGVHPHDAATFLDAEGIAVRAGMHCTQPLMTSMQLPGTVRASFSIYNTREDGERLVDAVKKLAKFWR